MLKEVSDKDPGHLLHPSSRVLPLGLSPGSQLCPSHSPCWGSTSRLCHSILPSQVRKQPAPLQPLSCHHFPAQVQLGPRWDMWHCVVGFIRHPQHCQAGKGARVHVLLLLGERWLHLGDVFHHAGERGEERREALGRELSELGGVEEHSEWEQGLFAKIGGERMTGCLWEIPQSIGRQRWKAVAVRCCVGLARPGFW